MSNGGDSPLNSGPGGGGSPGGGGNGNLVVCDHTGCFNPIQQTVIDLGDKLLVVSGTNCKQCGKVLTDLTSIPLSSSPLAKPGGLIKQ